MGKYLVSFGDSDKYAVEFPGTLDEFKKSDKVKELKDKVESYLKNKVPMGGVSAIVPLHIEEADDSTAYPTLDVASLLQSVSRQIGVEKFTDKLNLNAPFDKL